MKKYIPLRYNILLSVISLILFFLNNLAAFAIEKHGNTIKRDADGCTVDVIIQIAVDGTAADSTNIKNALDTELGGTDCEIPCPPPHTPCCHVKFTILVRLKSHLADTDQVKFHQIKMKADESPSETFVGSNNASSSGTWRSSGSAKVFTHETFHLLGLDDQYCGRHRNEVDGPVIVERDCTPPTACCVPPNIVNGRCSVACPGHTDDIMATTASTVSVSCSLNVIPVITAAGLNSCPDPPCCPDVPPVPINVNSTPTGGTTITPESATVPQYTAVAWIFTSYEGPNAPDSMEIILPPNSPVNFGVDEHGHPILHKKIHAGQTIVTSSATWPPSLGSVKYTIKLYRGNNLLQVIDPLLLNPQQQQGIPTFSQWGLVILGTILVLAAVTFIIRRRKIQIRI